MGRAFVFGDNVSTDLLAPGNHLKLPPEELVKHCMVAVDPGFVRTAKAGDIVVAGRNFGQGSSREQAVESLKLLGIQVILAKSFGRIFYRNAFNLGLPAVVFPDADQITAGDALTVDIETGRIENLTTSQSYSVPPIADNLLALIQSGGLLPQLEKRFMTSGQNLSAKRHVTH